MIQLDRTIITQEMIDAAADALVNEPALFGESIARFEEEFARFCGVDFAVSVNSGTDALTFSLMAAGVKGRDVLTTPLSYIATANSAFHSGGKPVFCDIDGATNTINPDEAAKALGKDKKIKAMIPVHLHGYPAAMKEITELAERRGIFVLEDACQAHGAFFFGTRVGAIGNAGVFSFNPFKNMTVAGDGGMVTTNDREIAEKVRMLADSGRRNPYTHEHALIGFTSRLDSMRAAIGRVQLRYLDEWNERRRAVAREYRKLLAGIRGLDMPPAETQDIKPAFNKFAIRVKDGKRDGLKTFLYDNGIESDSHYPIPIHLQAPYRALGYKKGDFPKAEMFADTTLSLPMAVDMTEEDIEAVSDTVRSFFGQ
jgi:perosamine synthetase